jgi:hypothetical protein
VIRFGGGRWDSHTIWINPRLVLSVRGQTTSTPDGDRVDAVVEMYGQKMSTYLWGHTPEEVVALISEALGD